MGNTEQTKKDIKQTSQSLKKERRNELTHSKEIKKVPGNSVQFNKESTPLIKKNHFHIT